MQTLSCKDLGTQDCNFVAKGNTKDEVINKMINHIRPNHADTFEDTSEEEMRDMLSAHVKETADRKM